MNIETPFSNVLLYLKNKEHITQIKLAETLSQESGLVITQSRINRFKSGKDNLSSKVIQALHKLYNINPDYLQGFSTTMLDEAETDLQKFSSLVQNWSTVKKKYTDKKGTEHSRDYLFIKMSPHLYNFLVSVDSISRQEKQFDLKLNEEFQKSKSIYNDSNMENSCEYIIIPRNEFQEIIEYQERQQLTFDECINYSEHKNFFSGSS